MTIFKKNVTILEIYKIIGNAASLLGTFPDDIDADEFFDAL